MALRKVTDGATLHAVQPRQHSRQLPELLAQLNAAEAEQRRWAARDLAAHPDAAPALGTQLLIERDSAVREALFTSLNTLANTSAAQALLPLLRSDDAHLRNGAIETLAAMPHLTAPCMEQLLRDPDPDVRILSVNLLGELRHKQVPQWLLQVLEQEQELNVVASAVDLLVELGDHQHVAALQQVRARFADDAYLSFAVDMALQHIGAA